jgi:hypothetical protein
VTYFDEVADRVIREAVHADNAEVEAIAEPARIAAAQG